MARRYLGNSYDMRKKRENIRYVCKRVKEKINLF